MTRLQIAIEAAWVRFGTLPALSAAVKIPIRTLEDWVAGRRRPGQWAVETIVTKIENAKPKKESVR